MKKDQYFNLEVNFLSNDNIVRMMMELDAAQSLGIYMMLLTHLRKADNYEASCCPLCMGLLRGCMTWMPMCCKGFSVSSTFLCLMKNGRCSVRLIWTG